MDKITPIETLKQEVIKFRDERNWKKYHNPKDVATSIIIEAGELLECFQWLNNEEIKENLKSEEFKRKIEEELADVIIYCLLFAYDLNINVSKAVLQKIEKNKQKYPVEKFRDIYRKPEQDY